MAEPTKAVYVGRCGSCKTGVAVEFDVEMRKVFGRPTPFEATTGEPLGDKRRTNCDQCAHPTVVTRVKGEYNHNRTCDSRCTAAYGPDCSCACGGANHGRYHLPRKARR